MKVKPRDLTGKDFYMGGKSEIINYENMAVLYKNGCNCVSKIKVAVKNIEEKIAVLKGSNLSGERGAAYRQALIAASGALYDLSGTTEKAAVYMDAKLNVANKADSNTQALDAARKKANRLGLKK
jgi:hypothetical protein